jgi:hypothetical protein
MSRLRLAVPAAALLLLTGCHSAYIEATVTNRTNAPVSLVELDYPSASFGTQTLTPGEAFHYRFKVLGSGPTKLLWTDSQHHDHTATGPALGEHDEGTLNVDITDTKPAWSLALTNRK